MRFLKHFNILALLSLLCMTAGCSKDDIVFDHELPQFETREGAYLLEVIVPYGTGANNEIYISGVFNGGNDEDVVNDVRWRLEKSETSNLKWGIYLFPSDFVEGTSLADGYHFVNVEQGPERTNANQTPVHAEMPALGGRCNVWVEQWAQHFEGNKEIEHDGYAIFVDDQTSWDALALYAWGDAEIFGGWPGAQVTGTQTINGVRYKYFDTGKDNIGKTENLIFNNNGGGIQLSDYTVTLDKDYFVRITDDGVESLEVEPEIPHDGYAVFVIDRTGWEEIACYAWSQDLPELFGGWPGIAPTGEQKINGMTYKYFDTGAANEGLEYNFIFNNNNHGKQIEDGGLKKTLDRNYYFWLKDDLTYEEVDPANLPEGIPSEGDVPVTPPAEKNTYKVFIHSLLPWDDYALYAYGTDEVFGTWPGQAYTETKQINDYNFMVFTYEATPGASLNLILNDNGKGQQVDVMSITADRDYFIEVSAEGGIEIDPSGTFKIYVDDSATGWPEIAVYAWSTGLPDLFGGWPGEQITATETVDGVTYKVVEYRGKGENYNLIFNNNNNGEQTAGDYPIVAAGDYFLKIVKNAEDKFVVEAAK